MAYLFPQLVLVTVCAGYVHCQSSVTLKVNAGNSAIADDIPLQLVGVADNGATTTYIQKFENPTATETFIVSGSGFQLHKGSRHTMSCSSVGSKVQCQFGETSDPFNVDFGSGSDVVLAVKATTQSSLSQTTSRITNNITPLAPPPSVLPISSTAPKTTVPTFSTLAQATFPPPLPTSSSMRTGSASQHPSKALIGGTVASVVLLLLLLICLLRRRLRRRKSAPFEKALKTPIPFDTSIESAPGTQLSTSGQGIGKSKRSEMRARERAPIDAQGEFRVAQGGPNRGDSARRERTLSLEQRVAEILERVRIMEERGNLPPDYESRE